MCSSHGELLGSRVDPLSFTAWRQRDCRFCHPLMHYWRPLFLITLLQSNRQVWLNQEARSWSPGGSGTRRNRACGSYANASPDEPSPSRPRVPRLPPTPTHPKTPLAVTMSSFPLGLSGLRLPALHKSLSKPPLGLLGARDCVQREGSWLFSHQQHWGLSGWTRNDNYEGGTKSAWLLVP